jgi:hypothetical protein
MADIRTPWLLLWPILWLVGAAALALIALVVLAWYPVLGLVLGATLVWAGVRRAVVPHARSLAGRR